MNSSPEKSVLETLDDLQSQIDDSKRGSDTTKVVLCLLAFLFS